MKGIRGWHAGTEVFVLITGMMVGLEVVRKA